MSFCTQCGRSVATSHRFCGHCGGEAPPPPESPEVTRAASLIQHRSIFGSKPDTAVDQSAAVERTRRPVLVMVGLVLAGVVAAWSGYRFVIGSDVSGGTPEPVSETEETITPALPDGGSAPTSFPAGLAMWDVGPSTHDVTDARESVGSPDGRSVTVLPGGALALSYRAGESFYNGEGADVRVHGPEGEAAYAVFIRSEAGVPWVRIDANRTGFRGGAASHDFGHHGIERGREIMIRNDGARAPCTLTRLWPCMPRESFTTTNRTRRFIRADQAMRHPRRMGASITYSVVLGLHRMHTFRGSRSAQEQLHAMVPAWVFP